jgi:hypothetical protein
MKRPSGLTATISLPSASSTTSPKRVPRSRQILRWRAGQRRYLGKRLFGVGRDAEPDPRNDRLRRGIPAPHLQLAIRLGVPGGHGTEFGWGNFFTLQVATPRAAHVAMAQALPYHPDVIKVFADGWRYGRDADLNSMNEPTLAAIVEDAHKAGLPVITHTVTLEGAKVAAAAGVDSVGHGVGDAMVDDELIGLMKAHHTAYIPTLVVYEPQEDRAFDPGEMASFSPPEQYREKARMAKPLAPIPAYEAKRWTIMQENIRRLKAAGIRIGIGTDAGIEGVYHGPGALREITWLTRLGFTPAEALVAATSTSAGIIGQDKDHGRIAPGMRADLVLYSGQPDQRIADLWAVARVFVSGREAPLPALRQLLNGAGPTPLPLHKMAGPIDTGARSDGRTDLDTLPVESTEAGVDHSHLDYVRPDEGDDKRLFLVAHLGSRPQPLRPADPAADPRRDPARRRPRLYRHRLRGAGRGQLCHAVR